ncbi:MAG: hypothetical protein AAFO70_01485 [Pseudomonadota bacterium]
MKNSPADPDLNPDVRAPRGTASAATSKQTRSAPSKAAAAKRKVAKAASSAAETAKQRAARLSNAVENEAEGVVDDAISRVHDTVDAGKEQASGYVGAFGRAFEAASDSLDADGMSLPATYVRAAANGLNQAAHEVDGFNTSSLTGNVERYVRGNPMLAVAGLALAGFALANIVGNKRR